MEDEFPGVSFYESARQVSITSEETTIDFENELGLSLSIPENAVDEGEIINLVVRPAFSGPFAGHEDMEPVSPAYLVRPSKEVSLKKDMVVRIQHNASLATMEDCQDLVFLTASFAPRHRESLFGPLYVFHNVIGKEARFDQDGNDRFGELQTNRFSWFMIWRRRVSSSVRKEGGHLHFPCVYSARLYRGNAECRNRAVFCMCQQHPQYIKVRW